MKKYYFIFIISLSLAQYPLHFSVVKEKQLNRFDEIANEGLKSNSIVDIRIIDEEYLLFSTANGLSYAEINSIQNIINFGHFNSDSMIMPRGGIPALIVKNNIIALSGLIDTLAVTGEELMGTGISYSLDTGEEWTYLPQPIDDIPSEGKMHTIIWGEQEINAVSITTEINNITYDIAIHNDFIYTASWAGGLRRYGPMQSENKFWKIIPLPMDDQGWLECGQIDTDIYEVNPNDPDNQGNHNHKGFSVYIHDQTIWVGTANGINKGTFNGNCISWEHYRNDWNNITGDWVIGFHEQNLDNNNRLWAITWASEGANEKHGLSYTDDRGNIWNTTFPSNNAEKIYNLFSSGDSIWAAAESGLYLSLDGKYWEKYSRAIDSITNEELLVESVLSVSYHNSWLWIGTEDGISIIDSDTQKNTIHRYWEKEEDIFSAYPNPFFINSNNIVNGVGHVRFRYSNPNQFSSTINIFDFSMNKVIELNNANITNIQNEEEIIWNGKNEYGLQVSNGTYFCRLSLSNKYYWTKLAVIN